MANKEKGVFTSLIENLGVEGAQFEELISLDADTIRSLRYPTPPLPYIYPCACVYVCAILIQVNMQPSLRRNLPLQIPPRDSLPKPLQPNYPPRRHLRHLPRREPLLRRANNPKRLRNASHPLRHPEPGLAHNQHIRF